MIELEEVTLRYGRHVVLSGVSHRFRAGTTTALVGPSGAGKSTLLYVLGLLLTPQGGRCSSVAPTWSPSRSGNEQRCGPTP